MFEKYRCCHRFWNVILRRCRQLVAWKGGLFIVRRCPGCDRVEQSPKIQGILLVSDKHSDKNAPELFLQTSQMKIVLLLARFLTSPNLKNLQGLRTPFISFCGKLSEFWASSQLMVGDCPHEKNECVGSSCFEERTVTGGLYFSVAGASSVGMLAPQISKCFIVTFAYFQPCRHVCVNSKSTMMVPASNNL